MTRTAASPMPIPDDQPPSPTGLFRTWPRLYAAVIAVAVVVYLFLFFFSRAFAP